MNPQDGQGPELNPEHVFNSLANQVATLSLDNAKSNAVIIQQATEIADKDKRIKELEMENKQLHEGKENVKKGGKKDE